MLYDHSYSIHFSRDISKAKKRLWVLYIPKVKISSISCISFYSKKNKSGSTLLNNLLSSHIKDYRDDSASTQTVVHVTVLH